MDEYYSTKSYDKVRELLIKAHNKCSDQIFATMTHVAFEYSNGNDIVDEIYGNTLNIHHAFPKRKYFIENEILQFYTFLAEYHYEQGSLEKGKNIVSFLKDFTRGKKRGKELSRIIGMVSYEITPKWKIVGIFSVYFILFIAILFGVYKLLVWIF